MMPEDWFETLSPFDAIFYGAVGWPATVPDHVSLWGSLIQFRRRFDQYVNLRPCRLMPGIATPLANRKPGDIDFVVVRENTEGEYSSVGGRMFEGTEREIVFQESVFSRKGVDRILKFAFELAAKRAAAARDVGDQVERHLDHDAVLGRALSRDGRELPGHPHRPVPHRHPDRALRAASGAVSTSSSARNLFGDILSDLGPAVCGTIGIAPSAQHQSGAQVPVAVRAGARLGARHRRQGHRQSDRPDLVGRADARDSSAIRRPRARSSRRSSACSPIRARRARGDIGGRATTADVGKAIAARYDRAARRRRSDAGMRRKPAYGTIAAGRSRGASTARATRPQGINNMLIGIPRETRPGETRVAATPGDRQEARRERQARHRRRSRGAGMPPAASRCRLSGGRRAHRRSRRGARRRHRAQGARARPPTKLGAAEARRACWSACSIPFDAAGIEALARAGVTGFALEAAPRITRAQSMDVLSSQANIAGYKAVIIAAERVPALLADADDRRRHGEGGARR